MIAETNCILKDKEVQIQALVEESNIILKDKDLTIQTLQEKLVVVNNSFMFKHFPPHKAILEIQAERRGLIRGTFLSQSMSIFCLEFVYIFERKVQQLHVL